MGMVAVVVAVALEMAGRNSTLVRRFDGAAMGPNRLRNLHSNLIFDVTTVAPRQL